MSAKRSTPETGNPDLINFVELLTTDIFGQPKGLTVPISPVPSVEPLANGAVPIPHCGIDGSSVRGLKEVSNSDIRLVPDISTVTEVPGVSPRRACVFTHMFRRSATGDLEPHPLSTRAILHQLIKQLAAKKIMVRVKLEPEFYYLQETGEPLDRGKYAELFPKNLGADLLLETALNLRLAGIEARWLHSEHGEGQQEIEIDFTDLSRAADSLILFKLLVRRHAAQYDVETTFMPKPFPDQAGSGLHCHIQVWQNGRNLLGQPDGTLSEQGRSFVAGLLNHAPAITAIANPTINSYKRLVPDFEAPTHIAWGYMNRSALIRIPLFTEADKAAVEFRSPDPLANPYLLLTVLITAGLDGLDNKQQPPDPISGNLYKLSPRQRAKLKVKSLPQNLHEALQAFLKDRILQEQLGPEFSTLYHELHRAEWEEYILKSVTDFEWDRYLQR
jgi:glutamine synthetase